MIREQDFERWVNAEFNHMISDLIWQNEDGVYEAFGHYKIVPHDAGYSVYISDDSQGFFHTSRSAVSWCVADKYQRYNLARDILTYDNMLAHISNDIFVRAGVASKTKDPVQRENIEMKLEPRIIQKKELATQLAKCVNWAKYLQQKGFENETSRSGTATTIKTNR